MKIRKAVCLVGILFCLVFVSRNAYSGNGEIRIGGESLRANGQVIPHHDYFGPCPVDLEFGWGVIGMYPRVMEYHFERSDGGHSAGESGKRLPGGNRSMPVNDRWRLGATTRPFANYSGWVKLVIDAPERLEGRVGFTLHCQ